MRTAASTPEASITTFAGISTVSVPFVTFTPMTFSPEITALSHAVLEEVVCAGLLGVFLEAADKQRQLHDEEGVADGLGVVAVRRPGQARLVAADELLAVGQRYVELGKPDLVHVEDADVRAEGPPLLLLDDDDLSSPCWASRQAVYEPAVPPPTITTSTLIRFMLSSLPYRMTARRRRAYVIYDLSRDFETIITRSF